MKMSCLSILWLGLKLLWLSLSNLRASWPPWRRWVLPCVLSSSWTMPALTPVREFLCCRVLPPSVVMPILTPLHSWVVIMIRGFSLHRLRHIGTRTTQALLPHFRLGTQAYCLTMLHPKGLLANQRTMNFRISNIVAQARYFLLSSIWYLAAYYACQRRRSLKEQHGCQPYQWYASCRLRLYWLDSRKGERRLVQRRECISSSHTPISQCPYREYNIIHFWSHYSKPDLIKVDFFLFLTSHAGAPYMSKWIEWCTFSEASTLCAPGNWEDTERNLHNVGVSFKSRIFEDGIYHNVKMR